jgi:DNA-binding response OmpR family regulator
MPMTDRVLVLSDEPALAATLASELPEFTFESAPAGQQVNDPESFRLAVVDGADKAILPAGLAVVTVTRPVRLSLLIQSIEEKIHSRPAARQEPVFLTADYVLSPAERCLQSTDGNVSIPLTEKEIALLSCLIGDLSVTRETLLQTVWGYGGDIATHTLETHIYRLRGKLAQAAAGFDIIASETGSYSLKY